MSGLVHLQRREPARRMARFYLVGLQRDLLEGWAVLREWGRIGQGGKVRADLAGDLQNAEAAAEHLAMRKRRWGYQ